MKTNENIQSLFLLDKNITYLNHGSFGACPKPVFNSLIYWQTLLENQPVDYLEEKLEDRLNKSKSSLSSFIHCDSKDLVFFPNPTTAMNEVIKSINLNSGDEVLTTNHEYGAIDKTWEYVCKKRGAVYIKQIISSPINSKQSFIDEFFNGLTNNTKIVFISHITSPTGLIFPVNDICKIAKEKGLITIVDGAHVPGHIDLNLFDLDVDIYVGACHKWLLCPKGVSFLYVTKHLQKQIVPLIISWGFENDKFTDTEFQNQHLWQGTQDVSNYLTIPEAIRFRDDNVWDDVSRNCKQMIQEFYFFIHNKYNIQSLLNDNPKDWLGQMCAFEIPINVKDIVKLKRKFINHYKIEIPIIFWQDKVYLRISINGYNSWNDIDVLVEALNKEIIYK